MKFIDLFCGGGFGAYGAHRGGGKPILAVDVWDLATRTYKANFPNAVVVNKKIEDINPYELAQEYDADVLLTSPECTAHSIARGALPGSETSRESALSIIHWIRAFQPNWVIVENVNRMKKWDRHVELVSAIEDEGFRINDMYLNSNDFGSAQARKRMFLVCSKDGHALNKTELIENVRKKTKSAKDIIDWSKKHKSRPLKIQSRSQATLDRAERAINALGSGVPFLIVYYGSDYAGGWQSIDAPLRTITTLDRFGLVTWESGEPHLRMLQPEELKKAMAGDEKFKLPFGTRREKVKLCGNGVCSDVMTSIFRDIKKLDCRAQ